MQVRMQRNWITSYIVCINAKCYRHSGKQFGISIKLKMHLPYDPAICEYYHKEMRT